MPTELRILFLAAEVTPFVKTGGLADVIGSLPKALASLGHDVRVVVPAYTLIEHAGRQSHSRIHPTSVTLRVPTGDGLLPAGVFEARLPGSDVRVSFIAERSLFNRSDVYGYADDPYRFAFFCRAALDLVVAALGWRPDVVHAHDWHAAASVFWLASAGQHDERYRGIPTVFTIHNLRHQGRAPRDLLRYLQIDASPLREEGPGELNLLARAVLDATMVSTVSPTYAGEILTPAGGNGLDGLLRYRQFDVHGILNGLDYDVWNPQHDPHLAAHFDVHTLERRIENKRALQARLRLPQRDDVPLVAMVSRLDQQKGFDIVGHVVHLLMNGHGGDAQFVVLGSGEPQYEDMFRHLASYHREKMTVVLAYDTALAPLIYGGSDIFLMPSLFEPCGLGQMIAMRYGSIPVVRATGGLADTVRDGVSGFTFHEYRAEALWEALGRATDVYRIDRDSWRAMQAHGMRQDFSWKTSAHGYQQLYEWAIARQRGW